MLLLAAICHSKGSFIYSRCLKTVNISVSEYVGSARGAPGVLQAMAEGCELLSHSINHHSEEESGRRCWWELSASVPSTADRWGSLPTSPARGWDSPCNLSPENLGLTPWGRAGSCVQSTAHVGREGTTKVQCQKMPQSHGLKTVRKFQGSS